MENIGGLIAAIVLALLITTIAALGFGKSGPWGSRWTFFLILVLALWTVSIYVRTIGPVYWNVAWVPLVFFALVMALLLIVIIPMPDANHWRDESIYDSQQRQVTYVKAPARDGTRPPAMGLFWGIVIALIIAIIVGMANPQMAL